MAAKANPVPVGLPGAVVSILQDASRLLHLLRETDAGEP